MSNELQRQGLSSEPPKLNESYWSALLEQGEFAEPLNEPDLPPQDDFDWQPYESANGNQAYPPIQAQAHHLNADWQLVRQTYESDETTDLTVIGYNRGGLLVAWNNLRGFVPASQLVQFTQDDGSERREELADRVGQTLTLRVIELDPEQNRLILSERAAQVQPGTRANLLNELGPGDTVIGRVTNLCDFGAFVDLGGLEGLIHISELSWGRVGHPAD